MKWEEVFTVNEEAQTITFTKSDFTCAINDVVKTEVVTSKVQKEVSKEILNSIANALTDSISNGQEFMKVHVRVILQDGQRIDIPVSKDRVIRFSDTYNEDVRIARQVQKRIRELK